jgi:hypothetical protein
LHSNFYFNNILPPNKNSRCWNVASSSGRNQLANRGCINSIPGKPAMALLAFLAYAYRQVHVLGKAIRRANITAWVAATRKMAATRVVADARRNWLRNQRWLANKLFGHDGLANRVARFAASRIAVIAAIVIAAVTVATMIGAAIVGTITTPCPVAARFGHCILYGNETHYQQNGRNNFHGTYHGTVLHTRTSFLFRPGHGARAAKKFSVERAGMLPWARKPAPQHLLSF